MTEEPARLLAALLRERFPSAAQVEAEAHRPVPALPFRRGGVGLTRLEFLLLRSLR